MSKRSDHQRFHWKDWSTGKFPTLEAHSEKKLELIRDYLVLYLEIVLKGTAGKDEQFITLVDGFAGGGRYNDNKAGSPLVLLSAVQEAEAKINRTRAKPTRITPICYFIEKDKDAYASLEASLKLGGYGNQLGKTIHLHRASFENIAPKIVHDINDRHKRGGNRTIFLLDQCGWAEISALTIKQIFEELHCRPEFIINFSISWLVDFVSEKSRDNIQQSLMSLGLAGLVNVNELVRLKDSLDGHWQYAIESKIGEGFHRATGISHFSPFYIEPYGNHRGYWILHLAGSSRARSAMTEIHWSKANRSKHYGHIGYDMLAYKPDLDQTSFIKGMSFDEVSKEACFRVLTSDFSKLLKDEHKEGISYKQFIDMTTNKVLASAPMAENIIWNLCQSNELEITCPSGTRKRSKKISDSDIILPRRQLIFPPIWTQQP